MAKDRPPSINETNESFDKVEKVEWESKKQKDEYDFSFLYEKNHNNEISEQDNQTFEQKEKATEGTSYQFDYLERKENEKKEKNNESNEASGQKDKTDSKKQIKKEAIEEIIDVDPSVKGLKFAEKSKEKLDEQETKRQEAELGQVEQLKEDKIEVNDQKEKNLEIHNDEKTALKLNLEVDSVEKRTEDAEAQQLHNKQREKVLEQGEKTERHLEEDDKVNSDGGLGYKRHMEKNFESDIESKEESSVEQLGLETTEEQLTEQKFDDLEQNLEEKLTQWKITEGEKSSELDLENEQPKKSIERGNIEEQPVEAKPEQSFEENFEMSDKTNFDEGEQPRVSENSDNKAYIFFEQMNEKRFESFRDNFNKWDELSNTERIAAMEDLNSKLVEFMAIKKEPSLKFVELQEGENGSYYYETSFNLQNIENPEELVTKEEIIELNTRNLDNPGKMATTLIHELQHAKQHQRVEAVNNMSKYSMYKPAIESRIDYYIANPELNPVKEWSENIDNYKDPDQHGFKEYWNQPIEEDARNAEKLIKIVLNERESIQQNISVEQIKIGDIMEFPTNLETQQFFQNKLKDLEELVNNDLPNPHNIEYKKDQINKIWEEACRDYQLYDAPSLDLNEFEAQLINPEQNEIAIGKYDKNAHSIKLDGKYLTSLYSSELKEVLNEHFQEAISISASRRAELLEFYQHSLYEKLEEKQFNTLERWNDKSLVEKVISFNDLEESILEQHGVDIKIKIIQDGTLDAGNVVVNLEQKEISLSMEVLKDEQSVKNVIANNLAEMKMKEWAVVNSEIRFEQLSKHQIDQEKHLEVPQKIVVKEVEESLDYAEQFRQFKDYLVVKADALLPQQKWDELTRERDRKSEMTDFLQGILKEGDFDTDKIEFQRNIRSNSGDPQLDFSYKKNSREIIMERNLLNEYTRDDILESFAEALAERKIEQENNRKKRVDNVQNYYEEKIHFFLENEYDIDDERGIGFFVEQWELYNESEKIERVHFIIEKFSNEPGIKNQPEVVFELFDSKDETFRYERFDNTITLEVSLLNDPDALIKGISRGLAKAQEIERERIEPGTSLFEHKPDLEDIRYMGEDIWYGNDRSTYSHIFDGHIDENGNVSGLHYHGNDPINPYTDVEREFQNAVDSEKKPFNAEVSITSKNQNGQPIKYIKKNLTTMFPRNMSPKEVIDSVNEAYIDAKYTGKGNQWRGVSSNGMPIIIYLDENYRIISAFPEI